MKKLLLITFLFLITPKAKADMDYVCETAWSNATGFIYENCRRDNILRIYDIPQALVLGLSAVWCRQDREINIGVDDYDSYESTGSLVCVLYGKRKRQTKTDLFDN